MEQLIQELRYGLRTLVRQPGFAITAIFALALGIGANTAVLAAIGIVIGLAGSWLLTGSLQALLFEVSPLDPAVIGLTCVAVLLVTIVASYVPARRALRVDPMSALRSA